GGEQADTSDGERGPHHVAGAYAIQGERSTGGARQGTGGRRPILLEELETGRRPRSPRATLQRRDIAGLRVNLQTIGHLTDPWYPRDPAQQVLDFILQNRAGHDHAAAVRLNLDGARMTCQHPEVRAYTLDQALIGDVLELRTQPGSNRCPHPVSPVTSIPCQRFGCVAGDVRRVDELIANQRPPPPTTVRIPQIHQARADPGAADNSDGLVHGIPRIVNFSRSRHRPPLSFYRAKS